MVSFRLPLIPNSCLRFIPQLRPQLMLLHRFQPTFPIHDISYTPVHPQLMPSLRPQLIKLLIPSSYSAHGITHPLACASTHSPTHASSSSSNLWNYSCHHSTHVISQPSTYEINYPLTHVIHSGPNSLLLY